MKTLIEKIFKISDSIRYVAIYQKDELISKQRVDLKDTSSSESDKYEELLVNPTILKITGQRGKIDCGGLDYIILKYGNFFQILKEYKNGHISICIDKNQNPLEFKEKINKILDEVSI